MSNSTIKQIKAPDGTVYDIEATKADTLTGLTSTVIELNYCDGVTSNIQTQLNNKQPAGSYLTATGTAEKAKTLDGLTISVTELNSWKNTISNLQEQINNINESGSTTVEGLTNVADYPSSSLAILGTAKYTDSLAIMGNANSSSAGVALGYRSSTISDGGVAIGENAKAINGAGCISIGSYSSANNNYCISIGESAQSKNAASIAIGYSASATAYSAIQIGKGTNNNIGTLKVGFMSNNSNYELLSSDGTIPIERLAKVTNPSITTLATSGTITLADNSINNILISGSVTFLLPTVSDASKFHQILVQLRMDSLQTIDLGTSCFFNSETPDLSKAGTYDLIYEYSDSNWYCGVIKKGTAA